MSTETPKDTSKDLAKPAAPVKRTSTLAATLSSVTARHKAAAAEAKAKTDADDFATAVVVVGDRVSYDVMAALDPAAHELLTSAASRAALRFVDDGTGWLAVPVETPADHPNAMGV
jgi:hypothetical protein